MASILFHYFIYLHATRWHGYRPIDADLLSVARKEGSFYELGYELLLFFFKRFQLFHIQKMSLTLDDRVKELDSRSRGIAFRRMIKGKSVWITLGTYLEQKKKYIRIFNQVTGYI